MTSYIAVDLGGTNIRAARYAPDAKLIARAKHPTQSDSTETTILDRVLATVEEVLPTDGDRVKAISIGAPGPLDPFAGVILSAPNLPGWIDLPLKEIVQSRLHIPTELGNDANLAAMGEWKFGAGRGHSDVLYLTISTGIGAGVISSDHLIVGANGLATELGHVTVLPDGPMCGCGQRGHLEALASGPSIARAARERLQAGAKSDVLNYAGGDIEAVTAKHIGEAAHAGDGFAIELLSDAGTHIGHAIADFMHAFNPSIVILGGGVTINVGDLLLEPARRAMRERVISDIYYKDCAIVQAQLGDDVGLLGALALALETHPM